MRDADPPGVVHEPLETFRAAGLIQPEADPEVDAAFAEMPVRRTRQIVRTEQVAQVADEVGQTIRRHRGVLEAGERRPPVGQPRDAPGAVLADAPEGALRERRFDERDVRVPTPSAKGGGKGVLTISQVATGEENGLTLRVYGSKGAILWAQENPNYLNVYRYGEPRQVLTRGQGYLSEPAAACTRVPTGHPEGYLEAFATIYCGVVRAIRRHIEGRPLRPDEYDFPTVHDGLRGMRFINQAVESSKRGAV